MIDKIITTEADYPVKAEFDRIRMPDESKRRVLEQLLKDKKERENAPENAVRTVSSGKAKISGSKPLVSIAAAVSMCIAGVWALVSLDGGIKDSGDEELSAPVKSAVSQADSSDYSWGGANLDSALDYSIEMGKTDKVTPVDLTGLFRVDSQIQSNPLQMKLEAKNGKIYALRISGYDEEEDTLGKITAVRDGDKWNYSMTESVSLAPNRNNCFIPGGFYSSAVYSQQAENEDRSYDTGFDFICYNDDMQKIGEWNSKNLDIYKNFYDLYNTGFLLSEDMQTLYVYSYHQNKQMDYSFDNLVLYKSEAGTDEYTEVKLPENDDPSEQVSLLAVNNGRLYYESYQYTVTQEGRDISNFEIGYYDLNDGNKKYSLFNNYDLFGDKKIRYLYQYDIDSMGRLYYSAFTEDGEFKAVRIDGSEYQVVYQDILDVIDKYYYEVHISYDGVYMSLLTEDSKEQNTEVSIIDLDSGETVNNITSASNMHCAAIDSVNKCIYLNDYTGTNIFYRYDLY